MISLFGGTGFLGTAWRSQTEQLHVTIPRTSPHPASSNILYMISTTTNYNVLTDNQTDVETNLVWLLKVLSKVKPGDTFNFVSSWFVYGFCPLPATEETPCDPRGFYSITKRAAEQLLISYCQTKGINWRIFRMANLYGPGDRNSLKKNAMQTLVEKVCAREESVPLYWGGNSVRDYLWVTDAARAVDICMSEAPKNSITNIGSGKAYRLRSIIDYAKKITGSETRVFTVPPPQFHEQVQARNFHMDVTRLRSYGFKRQVTMKEGIKKLCHNHLK